MMNKMCMNNKRHLVGYGVWEDESSDYWGLGCDRYTDRMLL